MTLCPECGALLKAENQECWSCGSNLEIHPNEKADPVTAKDCAAAFLMLAIPLLAYYIVYLKGL